MDKKNFAFGKKNYIICAISVAIIIIGFILMGGPETTFEQFQPDIFSTERIVIAPMISFGGFLLMIVGILYTEKKAEQDNIN